MREGEDQHACGSSGEPPDWVYVNEPELLAGMRDARPEAVDAFIARFEPLVRRYSVWLRIPADERVHWTGEVLFDVARTLGNPRANTQASLSRYIAGACRWKAKRYRDQEKLRAERTHAAAEDVAGTGERVEAEACSAHALRVIRGTDWEPPVLSPVLERLASVMDGQITDQERELLAWMAEHASYTTIASWLAISRPAAVSRVQRLRKRLLETACRFVASLGPDDAVVFIDFLRRTGTIPEARLATLERASDAAPHARRAAQ